MGPCTYYVTIFFMIWTPPPCHNEKKPGPKSESVRPKYCHKHKPCRALDSPPPFDLICAWPLNKYIVRLGLDSAHTTFKLLVLY